MLQTISLSKPITQQSISACLNDRFVSLRYTRRMTPGHDWYAKEWLATLGKKQADIVRDLEWNKSRASLMIRGIQAYDRDSLNELATYLNLQPHELLMHPADAMALRQLKATARQIVRIPFAGSTDDEVGEIKVSAA
jgi:hypothetical protein